MPWCGSGISHSGGGAGGAFRGVRFRWSLTSSETGVQTMPFAGMTVEMKRPGAICRVSGPQRWMKYISQLATMTDPAKSTKQ
jgi:hypothetical protein